MHASPWLLAVALVVPPTDDPPPDPSAEAVDGALSAFGNALADVQLGAIADVEARILALHEQPLLELRKKALKALKPVPRSPTPVHEPATFAGAEATRARLVRTPADPDGPEYADKRGRFHPWFNQPPFACRVTWNFGSDRAEAAADPIAPYGRLWNALNGYVPDSDSVVAWLLSQWDFADDLDAKAAYFAHAYCDLNGKVYPDITLYDAWSSSAGMDMPDVDTIAFARGVLGDNSYVAPLPADERRQQLYSALSDGFLEYHKYRVWIESAAWIFVNPDADALREAHEPMRRRLLYLFAEQAGDVARIGARLKELRNRDRFIEATDAAIAADPAPDRTIARFVTARAAERWNVARAAHAALRARQLLTD